MQTSNSEDLVTAYTSGEEISPDDVSRLESDLRSPGSNILVDQIVMGRLLAVHYQEDMTEETASQAVMGLIAQKSAEKAVQKEAWVAWAAQALQVLVLVSCAFMLLFNYHVYARHYSLGSPIEQSRMILSFLITFLAAFVCIGAPHVAYWEAKILSWFTGVWKRPTQADVLILRFQTMGMLALTFLLFFAK